MEFELYNLDKSYRIMNIYDYLCLNDLRLNGPFYLISNSLNEYMEIFIYRKKYLNENNLELKEFYLEKLILNYLNIRDFKYAIKYINKYIEHKYSKHKIYKKFLDELNVLFDNIKSKIALRNCRDIIINWIDNLRYDELPQMKYLNKISKDSMFFENAFTFTPWTTSTMQVMMTNKKTLDNNLFETGKINENNSCVLQFLKSKGYTFKYIGGAFYKDRLFDRKFSDFSKIDCCSFYQWRIIKNLILIDTPCFFLVHSFYETHPPFISGGELDTLKNYVPPIDEKELNKFREQKKESSIYLDNQIEWYDKFWTNRCIKIYMSDHGFDKIYKDGKLHVVLFLMGDKINNLICKKMFSYLNFYKLFTYIIEPNEENFGTLFGDYIEFQNMHLYDEHLINSVIEKGAQFYRLSEAVASRGVRTQHDKYVLYATGDELYFILPDEDKNRINEPQYKERINKLKKITGNYFINIYKYDKFKHSRKIYDMLKEKNFNFLDEVINGGKEYNIY